MNNTTYLNDLYNEDDNIPFFPIYVYGIFGIVGSLIILLTVFGNALTILSYIRDRKLHSVYNTYIFNFAIADFILGFIVMPIYLAYIIGPSSLWLDYYFCKVFLVIDFTACVEGVFMMIIISYDRLMLLRSGVSYHQRETKNKCLTLIASSWILSFLIYGPSIMFWDVWHDGNINIPGTCDVQFAHDSIFTTTTAVLEFFIPLVLLAVVDTCIIIELRKRTKFRISSIFRRSIRQSVKGGSTTTKGSLISATEKQSTDSTFDSIKSKDCSKKKENKKCQTDYRKHRERKAIKSLGILMVVFFITWAPYTIYTIIKSVKKGDIEVLSYEALTWFLWLKSAVNPVLYAFSSKRYRMNFKYFLCFVKNITRFNKNKI